MKKITLSLFAILTCIFANAQLYSEDFQSYSINDDNTTTGNQIQGGTGTVQNGAASGNTTQVLYNVHNGGVNDMFVRSKSFGVSEGDIINVSVDVATSNGVFVITMRNEVSPYAVFNASEPATCTNGTQGGANPGRIVQTANEFGTATAKFTIPAGVANARVQIYNFGSANTMEIDNFLVEKEPTASVKDLAKFNFKSYPNPASDRLNISAAKNIDKIEIYNLLGQEVKNRAINNKNAEVNISSLSNGIYLVKAFIDDEIGTYKFIKK